MTDIMVFFFYKQKTAYDMRISDWSSDVCSSDLDDLSADRQSKPAPLGRSAAAGEFLKDDRALAGGDARPVVANLQHRSEVRRVGKECVSTRSFRWSQSH